MRKFFFSFLILIGGFLRGVYLPPYVFAAEFSSSYEVTYKVEESGLTTVINKITLTNLKSDLYAKEYTVLIGSEKIKNPQGFDSLGKLDLKVSKEKDKTQISASFNEKVVGKGKKLTFTLSYQTPEIASRQGKIWEISIPKPSVDETVSSYKITLSVPASFGKPAYVKPKPAYGLTWTLKELSSPINVVFGRFQSLDFELLYHLKNNSLIPQIFQIPLPPDTLYQRVFLENISPLPENIVLDEDGNWFGQYKLFPQQRVKVIVKGTAFIFLEKRPEFPSLPLLDKKRYLKKQKFWEKDDQEIVRLAKKLKTAEKIYQYVVENLEYDLERARGEGKRLGAKKILEIPQKATCMEFTDLFIALCRAAGIPAREINGFGLSNNPVFKPLLGKKDILHAWPEYYDEEKKIWIPVDPTWQKTTGGIDYFHTFDFHHLVFVIHGTSSNLPPPPGAYSDESEDKEQKNVKVTFSQKNLSFSSPKKVEILLNFPQKAVAGRPIKGEIKVKNPNSFALYNLSLELFSSRLAPLKKRINIPLLPPLAQQTFKYNFSSPHFFFWDKNDFLVKVGGVEKKFSLFVQPLPVTLLPYLIGFSFFLMAISLIFVVFRKIWR